MPPARSSFRTPAGSRKARPTGLLKPSPGSTKDGPRELAAEEPPSTPLGKVTLPAPGVSRLPGGKGKQHTPVTWQSANRRAAQQASELAERPLAQALQTSTSAVPTTPSSTGQDGAAMELDDLQSSSAASARASSAEPPSPQSPLQGSGTPSSPPRAGASLESLPLDWRRRAEATMGALQRPLSSSQLSQPDGCTQRTVLAGSLELRLKAKQQAVLVAAAAKADAAALRNRLFGPGRQKAASASQDPAAEAQSCKPQPAAAEAESASVADSEAAAGPLVQLRGSIQRLQVEAGLAPLRSMQSLPTLVGDHGRPQWPADREAAQKALQRLGDLRRETARLLPKVQPRSLAASASGASKASCAAVSGQQTGSRGLQHDSIARVGLRVQWPSRQIQDRFEKLRKLRDETSKLLYDP